MVVLVRVLKKLLEEIFFFIYSTLVKHISVVPRKMLILYVDAFLQFSKS